MIQSVRYSLGHLFDPKGRNGRRVYWHYFVFVVLLNVLVMAITAVPTLLAIVGEVSQQSTAHNSAALEAALLDRMIDVGLPSKLVVTSIWLGAFNIVLMAASFVRRAHDAGLPGMVVLIPIGIQLTWMGFAYRQLGAVPEQLRTAAEVSREAGQAVAMQPGMIAQDLLGWMVVLILVLVGMAKSQRVPNQYGEGPIKL